MSIRIPKPEGGFVRIDEAVHLTGKLTKLDLSDKAGGSGYHFLIAILKVPGDHPKFPNAQSWWNASLSPKSVWSLRRFCREAGMDVPPDTEDWEPELEELREAMVGQEVEWRTEQDEKQPQYFNPVDVHVLGKGGASSDGQKVAAGSDKFSW